MARAKKTGITGTDVLLNSGKLPEVGVYVIFGDEPFLTQEVWRIVRERAVGDQDEGLAVTRFDGPSTELRDVLDELNTPSFFGGSRVVLVDDADKFISTYREQLLSALSRKRKRGVLVLRCKSWRSDTNLAKLVQQIGCAIDCRAPDTRTVAAWLTAWARQRFGKTLSAEARALLLEYTGPDLGRLHQELEKLSLYVGDRAKIEAEDVDRIVTHGRARTAWELADAVANANVPQALEILDRLLTAGESPINILYALGYHFRRLARAARLILDGMGTRQALKVVGVAPYLTDRFVAQLRRLGRVRLLRMYDLLAETDLALKSTDTDPRIALEELLIMLAAPQDAIRRGRFLRSLA